MRLAWYLFHDGHVERTVHIENAFVVAHGVVQHVGLDDFDARRSPDFALKSREVLSRDFRQFGGGLDAYDALEVEARRHHQHSALTGPQVNEDLALRQCQLLHQ